ncbi:MAG: permease [Sphaerochaetaceae bacterium]|nr:permease [Sphaerochaetaceae bacterium]
MNKKNDKGKRKLFTIILYIVAGSCLIISSIKDHSKTKKALNKALKSFENILPQFLTIVVIIGMVLSVLDEATISKYIGANTGILGIIISIVIGSITLIPGFVAFPLAAALLNNGAGPAQIAAFVSSLMMVGLVTLPMEISLFGKKTAILRNSSAVIFSIVVAFVMGALL